MAVSMKHRKILFYLYLSLFTFASSIRNPRWKEIAQWKDLNPAQHIYDSNEQQKTSDDYDCNSLDEHCGDTDGQKKEVLKIIEPNEIPFKRRPNSAMATYDKLLQMNSAKSEIIPYFHTLSLPLPCSCGSHYRLMDLGRAYHPRYLTTAECSNEACGAVGTYHCRPRPYRIRVLRRKDVLGAPPEKEPDLVNDSPLPETLRTNWVQETFTVTVACECGP